MSNSGIAADFKTADNLTEEPVDTILDFDGFIKKEEWIKCVDSSKLDCKINKFKKQIIGDNFYIVETIVSKACFVDTENRTGIKELEEDKVMHTETNITYKLFQVFHAQFLQRCPHLKIMPMPKASNAFSGTKDDDARLW